MKLRNQFLTAIAALTFGAATLLAGCSAAPETTDGAALRDTGIITLSVNPEISIEYNKQGQVTDLKGNNADGAKIVSAYPDYVGKDCETVLEELIAEIHKAGYFVNDVDGNKRNIVIQLEPGSVLPDSHFLEDVSRSAQESVKNLDLSSGIVTIDEDDYDPHYAKNGQSSPYITLEKAQEIALAQANVKAADAVFEDKEFDFDDGVAVFELEFTANGYEYDYDVDAATGKVLKAEHKVIQDNHNTDYGPNSDGVTDYDDTDYGPNNDGVTDYDDTDYGPNNDGVTDYDDTDYGPSSDGVTDYDDTDYGPSSDGVTDYDDTDYGVTDYGETDYSAQNANRGGSHV